MADVEWAKKFFDRVTATLPDLLTKHGEGKELEAIGELKTLLEKERGEATAKRKAELAKELSGLEGPTESPEPRRPRSS